MTGKQTFNGKCNRFQRGFTLVEILIVVVILGVLAAIVVPQFASAGDDARNSSLRMSLHRIRGQIEIYHGQHNCQYPPFDNFVEIMTNATNVDHQWAAPGTVNYPFGPYIQDFPDNPRTSSDTLVGEGDIGTSDWYYDQTTGYFRANDSEESASW